MIIVNLSELRSWRQEVNPDITVPSTTLLLLDLEASNGLGELPKRSKLGHSDQIPP